MKDKRQCLLQDLIEKMTKAIQSMHKKQHFSFDGLAVNRQQMMILFFIYKNKGVSSVKEIAEFLDVTPGAITQFVDGLVEKKIVQRVVSSLDRRMVNIKLSPIVKKDFNNFKKQYIELADKSFADFSDQELQQFISLVEKINHTNNQKKLTCTGY